MKILNNLTLKNLKLNKRRTIVTIIGIMLSTALICAVAGMVSSLQETLIQMAKNDNGNKHITIQSVKYEDLKYFSNNRNIENVYLVKNLGYAKLENSNLDTTPYLNIVAYTKEAFLNNKLTIVDGRLPQNENEIVIPTNIKSSALVNYKIGDRLSLEIGNRVCSDGTILNQNNPYYVDKYYESEDTCFESLDYKFNEEYTVVGIVETFNYNNEPFGAPGFTVVTYTDEIDDKSNYDVALLFQDSNYYLSFEKYLKNSTQLSDYSYYYNRDLLRYELSGLSNKSMNSLYGIAGVVIGIIILTSIFVIKNSFSISIVEKTKQYGMLASIGATSKQIKKNVLYEGFILGIIGIPLGILCGILADFILCKVVNLFLKDLAEIQFVFSVPIIPIIFSVILASITIYLSIISSAKKSSKISPIEAIRNNNEIKINRKKMRTPKIIGKVFGIGGEIAYKNLKRSRKKYRSTVVSLVVSVTVFISLSSFLSYGFEMTKQYYIDLNYNISVKPLIDDNNSFQKIYQDILKMENINSYSIHKSVILSINPYDYMTDEGFLNNYGYEKNSKEENISSSIEVYSLGDEEYKRFIKKIGGKIEDYENKGILIDDFKVYQNDDKYYFYNTYNLDKNDVINGTINDIEFSIPIAVRTKERPMGLEGSYSSTGYLIVSDKILNDLNYVYYGSLYIDSSNPTKLEESINKYFNNTNYNYYIFNVDKEAQAQRSVIILMAIFLYGFIIVISLIGITNIFNTITTNINLRKKEFAMLKSIGMTKKEFNNMISLESFFYGTKSLVIGVILGITGSYLIYYEFAKSEEFGYILPWQAITISIIVVYILVSLIMYVSVNKINKQNIIETIRNDNI